MKLKEKNKINKNKKRMKRKVESHYSSLQKDHFFFYFLFEHVTFWRTYSSTIEKKTKEDTFI